MPEGKVFASAMMLPGGSRLACQQSSMTTSSYPASFMPLLTRAAAADLTRSSLTLQAKRFQLFQPIGGVRAKPFSRARPAGMEPRNDRDKSKISKHNFLRRAFISSPAPFPIVFFKELIFKTRNGESRTALLGVNTLLPADPRTT